MIDEQSSASEHDYALDRSAIGAGKHLIGIPPGCQSVIYDHYFHLEVVKISSPNMMQIFSTCLAHVHNTEHEAHQVGATLINTGKT